jgi:hypothetical protein
MALGADSGRLAGSKRVRGPFGAPAREGHSFPAGMDLHTPSTPPPAAWDHSRRYDDSQWALLGLGLCWLAVGTTWLALPNALQAARFVSCVSSYFFTEAWALSGVCSGKPAGCGLLDSRSTEKTSTIRIAVPLLRKLTPACRAEAALKLRASIQRRLGQRVAVHEQEQNRRNCD